MELDKYKKLLKIDKHALDEALQNQPDLYYQVSSEYANAISRRDQAYENIKIVDANLQLEIRRNLEEEGKKVTDKAVESLVLSDEAHSKAVHQHLEYKKQVEELEAIKRSFEQRAHMIRDLVQLWISGYFMDNTVSRGQKGVEVKDNMEYKEVRQKIGKERNKKRS